MFRRLLKLFSRIHTSKSETVALLNQLQREALRLGNWPEANRLSAEIGRSR